MEWKYVETEEFLKRKRKWPKKYKRELAAVADHLITVFDALKCGATIESIRSLGFVHPEPAGVLAVDQKGGGAGLKQTRLYVFPETETAVLHVITLGDKTTQEADIKFCKEYAQGLIKNQEE